MIKPMSKISFKIGAPVGSQEGGIRLFQRGGHALYELAREKHRRHIEKYAMLLVR